MEIPRDRPLTKFQTLRNDQQLKRDLPHLVNCFLTSPHTRSEISVYDYDQDWQCSSTQQTTVNYGDHEASARLAGIVLESPPEISTRIMVIEDITSQLVENLVNILDINLEVFEQHLLNCKWRGDSSDASADSSTWNSRRVGKSHFSMKWFRPYKTNLKSRTMSIDDRILTVQDLFDSKDDNIDEMLEMTEYELNYEVGTWRSHLDLGIQNTTWSEQHRSSTNLRHATVLAGEERLTIWSGKCDAHMLILVLTDVGFCGNVVRSSREDKAGPEPLFEIRRPRTRTAVLSRNPQLNAPLRTGQSGLFQRDDATQHNVRNWLFNDAILDPEGAGQGSNHSVEGVASRDDTSTYFSTTTLPLSTGDANAAHNTHTAVRNTPSAAVQPAEPLGRQSLGEQNTMMDFVAPSHTQLTTLIRNAASRCPIEYTQLEQARGKNYFVPLTTTREDFGSWLEYATEGSQVGSRLGHAAFLFMIVYHDIYDFIRAVEKYLDEVIRESDDEVEIERKITLWRRMLGFLDQELRRIERDVSAFAAFMSTPTTTVQDESYDHNRSIACALTEVTAAIEETRRHLRYTNTVVTSSISVAESRRGINEAESVTRLTELAFIYVPLSFAASFFGMQVKELNPLTTSITGFVGLAVGVVAISYAARLIIRSQSFISLRTKLMTSVRRNSNVLEGQPIRTRDFIRWAWHKSVIDLVSMGKTDDFTLGPLLIIFPGIFVMISVWASTTLIRDMKLAISMMLVVLFIGLFTFVCSQNLRRLTRLLQRRRQRREIVKLQRAMQA